MTPMARVPRRWLPLVMMGLTLGVAQSGAAQHMVAPPPVKDAAGTPTGYFFEPSVVVSELYDDNLFLTPGRERHDWFLRVTPGLQAGYRSSRVLVTGVASFDGERYSSHRELDRMMARRQAGIDLSALATPRLVLRVTGGYVDTTTPSELNLLSGIVVARGQAQRYEARSSLGYRVSPRGTLKAGYNAAVDELEGFTSALTQEASSEYRFDITPRTFVTADYRIRTFDFEGPAVKPSHVAAFGVGHAFSPNTLLTVRGGPQVSYSPDAVSSVGAADREAEVGPAARQRSITPEWSVSLRRQMPRSELEISVARTQTTAIGQNMVIDTTVAGATLTYRPSSRVELRAAPGYYRDAVSTAQARVVRLAVDLTFWMTGHLALVSRYNGGHQDGSRLGDVLTTPLPTIRQHVVSFGLRATARRRVPPPEPGTQSSQGQ